MTKVQSHMMLVLRNSRMILSNVRKKNKGIIECDKSTITCDIGTAQCEDGTIKCKKKIRELPNMKKVQLYVILVLHRMVLSNVIFW